MMTQAKRNRARRWTLMALVATALCSGGALGQHVGGGGGHVGGGAGGGHPSGGGAHQHLDSRFSHNQYYYDRGYGVRTPPAGGLGGLHGRGGEQYYFHGGNWYRWRGGWYRWWGGAWVIWAAPIGLFVPYLPLYYTTVWWDGVPYYYANDAYYEWNQSQGEYEVVEPPAGIEGGGTTQAPASDQLFAYPKNGQSAEQQSKDRYECARWAVSQTGFDPTLSGGGVAAEKWADKRNDYFRAQVSCLEGRGYTVR